jgi:hypothetical protein
VPVVEVGEREDTGGLRGGEHLGHGWARPSVRRQRFLGTAVTDQFLPFANFHRIHVVPPCTIGDEEVDEALAALDVALQVADGHVIRGGT